ncbi:hypothetical protein EMIT0158MI4_120122 [Burkholderia ambifaria]
MCASCCCASEDVVMVLLQALNGVLQLVARGDRLVEHGAQALAVAFEIRRRVRESCGTRRAVADADARYQVRDDTLFGVAIVQVRLGVNAERGAGVVRDSDVIACDSAQAGRSQQLVTNGGLVRHRVSPAAERPRPALRPGRSLRRRRSQKRSAGRAERRTGAARRRPGSRRR